MIATKLGWEYDDGGRLVSAHTPEKLRAAMERDLRLLGARDLDRSSAVGKRSVGERVIQTRRGRHDRDAEAGQASITSACRMSGRDQLEYALTKTDVASVSNSYSVADQADSELVDFTTRHGIA